jgi:hypothetical protein
VLWSPCGRFGIVVLLLIPLSFFLGGVSAAPRHQAGIDPANFVPVADNRYFPLPPGPAYIYDGTNEAEVSELSATRRTLAPGPLKSRFVASPKMVFLRPVR